MVIDVYRLQTYFRQKFKLLHETKKIITGWEKEVLQLLAQGKSSPQIGWALSISLKTVETHRKNLYEKFEPANAFHLIYILTKKMLFNSGVIIPDFLIAHT